LTERGDPPHEVARAAEERSRARRAQDWQTADRLRGEIEAAGWRVIDAGTAYRLESASPPQVEVGGEIRYGRSVAVPSRLEELSVGTATVVLVASPDPSENRRAVAGLAAHAGPGVGLVVVADGTPDQAIAELDAVPGLDLETVRTSAALGQAAALNIGIRRSRGEIVVILDPSIEIEGDVIGPLVRALEDPSVAIAGPFGLLSSDLRHFDEVDAASPGGAPDVAAVEGYVMAFRRSDAAARGPLDEAFRFYRNLDIWWSLVLRDQGEGNPPRRAVVVAGLPLRRHAHRAWESTPAPDRDRLSKRNFYRVLDRFRTRLDLAVTSKVSRPA
jgi:hypothetical protein